MEAPETPWLNAMLDVQSVNQCSRLLLLVFLGRSPSQTDGGLEDQNRRLPGLDEDERLICSDKKRTRKPLRWTGEPECLFGLYP